MLHRGGRRVDSTFLTTMVAHGLRDQGRLEGVSNYVISKARITCLLDEYDLKLFVTSKVAVPADPDPLKKYTIDMAKAKRVLLDGFKDHIVSHIAGKDTAR